VADSEEAANSHEHCDVADVADKDGGERAQNGGGGFGEVTEEELDRLDALRREMGL